MSRRARDTVANLRGIEGGVNPVVDVLAQLAHLAYGDVRQSHCLQQIVNLPGRNATDPTLLDDGDQGLLRRMAGLKERWEVALLSQLWDPELQAPSAAISPARQAEL